jgi:adenylyltransferase/sulfurtransferase
VQIRPTTKQETQPDLQALATRLRASGVVQVQKAFLRFEPTERKDLLLSVFWDGRVIVSGTDDLAVARTMVARYVGH